MSQNPQSLKDLLFATLTAEQRALLGADVLRAAANLSTEDVLKASNRKKSQTRKETAQFIARIGKTEKGDDINMTAAVSDDSGNIIFYGLGTKYPVSMSERAVRALISGQQRMLKFLDEHKTDIEAGRAARKQKFAELKAKGEDIASEEEVPETPDAQPPVETPIVNGTGAPAS